MKFSFHLALPDKQKQGHKRERVCARVLWADGSHAVLWKSPLSTLFNRPYKTDSLLKYLTQEKRERQRREEERTTVKINKTALCDWCVKTMPDISVTINKCGRGHKGPNVEKKEEKRDKRKQWTLPPALNSNAYSSGWIELAWPIFFLMLLSLGPPFGSLFVFRVHEKSQL